MIIVTDTRTRTSARTDRRPGGVTAKADRARQLVFKAESRRPRHRGCLWARQLHRAIFFFPTLPSSAEQPPTMGLDERPPHLSCCLFQASNRQLLLLAKSSLCYRSTFSVVDLDFYFQLSFVLSYLSYGKINKGCLVTLGGHLLWIIMYCIGKHGYVYTVRKLECNTAAASSLVTRRVQIRAWRQQLHALLSATA